jgi:predicted transposase/invertase (TIGR01784 family)
MNKNIKKVKNSQINTPHDKLFKKSMQIPNVAKEFLMLHLPNDVKNKINYETLEVLPETFVDEQLRRSQVDALFKVKCGRDDLLIYILVEQQSKPDHTMPTRRLSYKSDIWAAYLETQQEASQTKLPPIIDLHFYTGPKPSDGPLSLADLAGDYEPTF